MSHYLLNVVFHSKHFYVSLNKTAAKEWERNECYSLKLNRTKYLIYVFLSLTAALKRVILSLIMLVDTIFKTNLFFNQIGVCYD